MILIIEPHADDAFLSLGGHIEYVWGQRDLTIVTVYSGTRKRAVDAKAYADAVGVRWVGLGAKERRGGGQPGDGTKAIKEWFKRTTFSKSDVVLSCLAVKHPDHIEVRKATEKHGFVTQYYLDQPYAAVQSNGPRINELIGGSRIMSYLRPPARKYRHVPLFKDQGRFFHFNPAEKMVNNIELTLEIA